MNSLNEEPKEKRIVKKDRVVVEYADTLEKLQVEGMKWHHDHAWFHFFGKTENVPEHLQEFISEDKEYVLLAEEDEPYIPDFKFQKDYFLGTPHTNKETKIDTLDDEKK